jgi:CBS domain-containing protein
MVCSPAVGQKRSKYLEKRVKHIIRPLEQYLKVHVEDTARDVLRLMERARREERPLCLLVVEQEQQGEETIKGFITPQEVVFGLATRFLKGAGKSGPIFWEGQLTLECMDGMERPAEEMMLPIDVYVRADEMLMEAVFLLYKSGKVFLPVANHEEVIGTVHIDDLLKEMMDITSKERSSLAVAVSGDEGNENNIEKEKEVRHV